MHRLLASVLLLLSTFALAAPPAGLLADLLLETNAARRAHEVPPLRPSPSLAAAAQGHAAEMAHLGYFSHASPTPGRETLAARLAMAGEPAVRAAENLALFSARDDLARAVVRGWLDSPSHRQALLESGFTHVGFGAAVAPTGEVYVVQAFAWKPWEYLDATSSEQGGRRLLELRYSPPLEGVRAYVDQRPAAAFLRGGRVVVVLAEGASELLLGVERGEEVVFFDAFRLAPDGSALPGLAGAPR